jgi:L-fuconolactonase
MRIDSHQHFWQYDPREYPWMTGALAVLQRDHLPSDLEPLLKAAGVDGCVAVQARQTLAESRWLLNLADHYPMIRGVVGWVDLRGKTVDRELEELARHPRYVGVRHVAQDEPDDGFLMREDFVQGVARLKAFELAYDILIYPRQLPAAIRLAEKLPEQRFVLDHLGKPFIKAGTLSPWKEQIIELARHPNVHCKVSGMVTEADWKGWTQEDFKPYLDVSWEAFGEDRLMFGSDWPVCTLSAGYEAVEGIVRTWLDPFPKAVREKIQGGNAVAFYGLKD